MRSDPSFMRLAKYKNIKQVGKPPIRTFITTNHSRSIYRYAMYLSTYIELCGCVRSSSEANGHFVLIWGRLEFVKIFLNDFPVQNFR